ncbi:hypothetical protein J6590_096714, partial [Homalodisca vitripennis]
MTLQEQHRFTALPQGWSINLRSAGGLADTSDTGGRPEIRYIASVVTHTVAN